ncbi:LysR substrate-binding domain-containing protein [Paraburkholderia phenoliruptrix]|uniref:LysR family transcriptional regulator n=2 Tax=Paraburkholderia phenoliruptrix TaxID=252970 RepID=K0DJJ8_9BURK|nr:LysR substrate-binding domain-containing protein [Paraburkholderia phenoliruptrix]AFT84985.1 LysR family transcriptional regulator [Paraburkholderia phenoliruptrix BR3459a]MDR6422500.1 DNA-binding transcriptional LysR family regulator [Paraburkholderia phenoliruptrix]CAB4050290.1 HTH-type transcriptional regulator TfdS [Paraburkholderia phenoliruptrix]
MDLKQMRYFMALAEEANFGRAAERLHMAQPPLTRNIRALEEELGTQLFVRTTKGAELTEAGRALMEEVPNILALARRAEEQAQLAGQGYLGRLDVGIFSSGILNVIPRLLAEFHTERPEVKIGLHNMSKAEQISALRERRITIGFNRLVPDEPDIAVEWVLREPFLVALYEGHRLCAKKTVTLRDLDNERMILYPNAPVHGLAQEVAAAFRAENLQLRVAQEVEDVVTCIALVASRFGICVTTESAVNLRLPGVVYRPLRSTQLREIELTCLYRRGDNSPILQAFLNLVRKSRAHRVRARL